MSRTPSHIEREKRVVTQMIRLYCRHKEGNATLCPACQALWNMPMPASRIAATANRNPPASNAPSIVTVPDARADANRHALRRPAHVVSPSLVRPAPPLARTTEIATPENAYTCAGLRTYVQRHRQVYEIM